MYDNVDPNEKMNKFSTKITNLIFVRKHERLGTDFKLSDMNSKVDWYTTIITLILPHLSGI
jgi:hypothetical protein